MATGSKSALPPEDLVSACSDIRDDGRWIDVDDMELTLGKLASHHDAVGILKRSRLAGVYLALTVQDLTEVQLRAKNLPQIVLTQIVLIHEEPKNCRLFGVRDEEQ
jgi:hypothetical protein